MPEDQEEAFAALRRSEGTGRPVGTAEFITRLGRLLGRHIARCAPGSRPAARASDKRLNLRNRYHVPLSPPSRHGRVASVGGGPHVSLNPVRASLLGCVADWAWSNLRAHLAGEDDGLVTIRPVLDRVLLWGLVLEDREEAYAAIRRSKGTARPVGTAEFITGLEPYSATPSRGVPQDQERQPAPSS